MKSFVAALAVLICVGTAHAEIPAIEFCNQALKLKEAKQYDAAIEDFNKCLKTGGAAINRNSSFFYNRGMAHYHKNDYDKAVADLTRSIFLKPTDARNYFMRSKALSDKDDPKAALID